MAPHQAKPQAPRAAVPAARGRRARPGAHGLGPAGAGGARCPAMGPGPASRDAPPPLLGLLLLAALAESCRAHPGAGDLQTNVTLTPESLPPGKLLASSAAWPFSDIQASRATDRIKTVLGQSPDSVRRPQAAPTPPPRPHRRSWAHADFSPALHQGSGQSAPLEPPEDAEPLAQPWPPGERGSAAVSGLLLSLPTSLPGLPSPAHPSQPGQEGTPRPSEPAPRFDGTPLRPPPGSPDPTVSSELPAPGALLSSATPPQPPSSPASASPLSPFSDEANHTPARQAQHRAGGPHPGPPQSSEERHPELPPEAGPHPAGSPTPLFPSPRAALAPLPHPPPAPRSPVRLPGRTPSQSILQMASNPASAELGDSQGAVPLGTSRHTAESPEAETLLLQTANSVAMEMTHRTLASAAAHSVNPPPPSESPGEPALSTELASSPLPALPLTAAGPGQAVLPGAALRWPGPGMAGFPSALPLQPAESPASAPWVPESPGLPGEASGDQSLLATATHLPLSSNFPDLLSTAWAIPWQDEDGVAALLGDSRKTNELAAPQAPPTLEVPSPQAIHRPTSDFSTDCTSSPATTAPRTQPLPLGSSVPFLPCTHAPRPGFSSTKPESPAAAADLEGVPISASKQVTGLPFSTDVGGSTGGVEQPAAAEVSRSPLSVETGSLPTELALSGPQQQTHSHLNGHVINPTSWETHSASAAPPQGVAAAGAEQPQGLQDMVGHTVTAEGLSTQERDLGSNLNQPIRPSGGTVIGNHVGLWPTSENNHSRDFQATEVERYPSASQRPPGRLQLPARPARPLLLTWPGLAPAARLQEMLSDGMETGWRVSSDTRASPVTGVSGPPHSALSFHSAFSRTLSKVLWASQRPRKWRGAATSAADSPEPSKAEPTAAAALPLRRVSPQAQSAALVAKGTGSSPSAVASGLAKSSPTTTLAKNVTNKTASGPKATPGTVYTALPFTPTYMFARTAHAVSTRAVMPGNVGAASGLVSTTHLPRKAQAVHIGPPNPTNPEVPRASTPRPLSVTAALAAITASAKATRLPPLLPGNTDAGPPAAATAVAAPGKMASNLECQMSRKLLVKTVLFLTQRRVQIGEFLKLSVAKGLTQALRKAFQQNDVSAHVDVLEYSHNLTVGYYATRGRSVYLPAVVTEMLGVYGVSNVTADLKQHSPNLQSVAVLASPWSPQPASYFQLKTVLQFVSPSDNIRSCRFAQTMEQRLQSAFQDAERRVLSTRSNLTIQIVSTSNASQAVTLVYVVGNQSMLLNGTVASSLLSRLSAELVGFHLAYPPLTIAEPLEYPNLDISEATRDYWVITVLQGVDNLLVGRHNQSFARIMEQRLAQLFTMSRQQGRRLKRAATMGSYTVQMVKMQRVPGPKDPVELTYYTLHNGKPLLGTAAAKILSTIDSQRAALTLQHVVLLQADPVVKNPPNNLWIIAAVLAPIAVVTVITVIIAAVLCRRNKGDFKPDAVMSLPQRAKPVQGFDYAKQHLGQQGADDEAIPVAQETVVLPRPVRDAPQERDLAPDGSTIKTAKSTETRKSRSPSETGSVISNESGKRSSGRRSPQNATAQPKALKEEARKRNVPASDDEEEVVLFDNSGKSAADPFDSSSGSVQLIAIKPTALAPAQPGPDRQEPAAVLNGEVNKALKQKSDIEHYRNKLRLKAKRKGYYDVPPGETSKGLSERKRMYEKAPKDVEHVLDPDPELRPPFAESKNRQQMKSSVYRSRQSLNSPSPGETEMDLLVTRERPRRGIRNSGYDTEPEIIEETNVDRAQEPRGHARSRPVKGHSETSTLSSQPSIDEVRQQMHLLLEEAFSLASAGHAGQARHQDAYGSTQHLPCPEVVTSAPGTMTRPRAGVQWVPTYRPEVYQYSLPRPAYRFSQLPEMVMGSPPPPVPPRTGPVAVTSLRRSTSDIGSKTRVAESVGPEPAPLHDSASFTQVSRGPVSAAQLDQSALHYSGNTVPAVFAIPAANRPGFTGYFIPTPPSSYRSQAWMSYAGDSELPGQWADSVPLPGYIEAYPRARYQQGSPSRLARQYSQPTGLHPSLEQAPGPSAAASQQSLAENDPSDAPLTNISTAALVKAIREEVAKLAKKQTDMFEFQV